MSGGSYDYLCYKDSSNIFGEEQTIQRMADRLAKLGFADDAALETQGLILEIRAARIRIDARIERLKNLWQVIEWVDSCDYGPDDIPPALAKYRGKT